MDGSGGVDSASRIAHPGWVNRPGEDYPIKMDGEFASEIETMLAENGLL